MWFSLSVYFKNIINKNFRFYDKNIANITTISLKLKKYIYFIIAFSNLNYEIIYNNIVSKLFNIMRNIYNKINRNM
jgi:hypothetical protein